MNPAISNSAKKFWQVRWRLSHYLMLTAVISAYFACHRWFPLLSTVVLAAIVSMSFGACVAGQWSGWKAGLFGGVFWSVFSYLVGIVLVNHIAFVYEPGVTIILHSLVLIGAAIGGLAGGLLERSK